MYFNTLSGAASFDRCLRFTEKIWAIVPSGEQRSGKKNVHATAKPKIARTNTSAILIKMKAGVENSNDVSFGSNVASC